MWASGNARLRYLRAAADCRSWPDSFDGMAPQRGWKCRGGLVWRSLDIKPANIVLGPRVVLADAGSVVDMGEPITHQDLTPQYAMDLSMQATSQYDLTCLASTLFQFGNRIENPLPTKRTLAMGCG